MQIDVADTAADILKSAALDVVPYAERVQALADRLGLDLSATVFALKAIPLCLARPEHPAARRAMAGMIADRHDTLRAALPGMVARHLAPLAQPGRVDMMGDVIAPLVSDVLSVVVGADIDVSQRPYLSRVFSQSLGPARRRQMEGDLAAVLTALRAAFPAADDDEIGLRLSLMILGRDALTGTLAGSLHALFAPGVRFAALRVPDLPSHTGVPYIDRMALEPVQLGGRRLEPGETVRAWLNSYEQASDARARLAFFGAGAHLCLGRALALDLWRATGARLTRLPGAVQVRGYALRRDDVFTLAETFDIEVTLP